jgi:MYXO-CTERM domain-containing protein
MFGTDGTGVITLIPSSGSMALLGLGALVAGRRRR